MATISVGALAGQTLGTFFRSFRRVPLAWIVPIPVLACTHFVIYGLGELNGDHFQPVKVVMLAAQLVTLTWIGSAVLRRLTDAPAKAWAIDRGTGFYFLWGVAVAIATGVLTFVFDALWSFVAAAPVWLTSQVPALAAALIVAFIQIRLAGWLVARVTRRKDISIGTGWEMMRGAPVFVVYLVLVVPLILVHLAVMGWFQHVALRAGLKFEMIQVDAALILVLAILTLSLYAAAFRAAREAAHESE